jgi:hypothetical protein
MRPIQTETMWKPSSTAAQTSINVVIYPDGNNIEAVFHDRR